MRLNAKLLVGHVNSWDYKQRLEHKYSGVSRYEEPLHKISAKVLTELSIMHRLISGVHLNNPEKKQEKVLKFQPIQNTFYAFLQTQEHERPTIARNTSYTE